MHERLRRPTAGRPIIDPEHRWDLVYRPVWRPTQPDRLDALIINAARDL